MTRSLIALLAAFALAQAHAQDSLHQAVRAPIWTFHDSDTRTYGLNFGVLGNEAWARNVTTVGARIEVPGIGLFLFLAPNVNLGMMDSASFAADTAHVPVERVHGLNLSPLGSACDCDMNGINLSGGGTWFHHTNGFSIALGVNGSMVHNGVQLGGFTGAYNANGFQLGVMDATTYGDMNGLQLGVFTYSGRMRGLQIGVFNQAAHLKGLQIGLWNVNQKRKLPILNWG